MGYYIQTKRNLNKAQQLVDDFDGEIIERPKSFQDIPEDKALVVVVENGLFDAAGYAFDEEEFECFSNPDGRRKKYVLMDKQQVNEMTGFNFP